jgi:hypothetical protein
MLNLVELPVYVRAVAIFARLICVAAFISIVCTRFIASSSTLYDCVHHCPVDHVQICRRRWDRARRCSRWFVHPSKFYSDDCYRSNFVSQSINYCLIWVFTYRDCVIFAMNWTFGSDVPTAPPWQTPSRFSPLIIVSFNWMFSGIRICTRLLVEVKFVALIWFQRISRCANLSWTGGLLRRELVTVIWFDFPLIL